MAETERVICASAELVEGGDGVRFEVIGARETLPAFVVRYDGAPRAFVNRCAHVPMQLDWNPGKFFDSSETVLVCSTHGASYDPETGRCIGGPCRGGALTPLSVTERDGVILLRAGD